MFQGAITALITPFTKDNTIDEQAFVNLIENQIAGGITGIVPCGTTGESPNLTVDEYSRLIELAVNTANGRIPVIAGAGSNSTDKAIKFAKIAEGRGADAVMVVVPYYNKPTQEGLYQHFKAVHDAISIPLVLYNIPGRTSVNMTDDTIVRLAELDNVVGIKDATGDMNRPLILRGRIGRDFCQLSGDDSTALSFNAQGGIGCISVAANIIPDLCANLQNLWEAGEYKGALELQTKLMPLYNVLFCETNPGPIKYAASLLGLCEPDVRLPLVEPSVESKKKIEDVVRAILL
jgi:4-hydroxy-tetrahydrodipicolinate synthase